MRIGRGLVGERAGRDVFRRRALEQLVERGARQPRQEAARDRVADGVIGDRRRLVEDYHLDTTTFFRVTKSMPSVPWR